MEKYLSLIFMRKNLHTAEYSIFILYADEMRHSYENTLASGGKTLVWFTTIESLLNAAEKSPLVVIVDLDSLKRPLEPQLEQLRFAFTNSELTRFKVGLGTSCASDAKIRVYRFSSQNF